MTRRLPASLRRIFALLLLGAIVAAAGCSPGGQAATPTVTPIPTLTELPAAQEPSPTTAPALPTDTPPAESKPTAEATATEAAPTATAAATATAGPGVETLEWQQWALAGQQLTDLALAPTGGHTGITAGPRGAWVGAPDYKTWKPTSAKVSGRTARVSAASDDVMYLTGHTGCASGAPVTTYRTSNAGGTWQQPSGANTPLAVAGVNATLAYGITCSGVVKSTDAGATWTPLKGGSISNFDPLTLAVSPDGQQIYVAYASEGGTGRVQSSTDAGATWKEITPKQAPGAELTAILHMFFVTGSVGRPDDGGLYMTSDQGLWFLPLESTDWKFVPKQDPRMENPVADYQVSALYVDTAYSEEYNKPGPIIYEARAGQNQSGEVGMGVFRSADGGQKWQQVGKSITPVVRQLVLVPREVTGGVETLLAATDDGIWALPLPPPFR